MSQDESGRGLADAVAIVTGGASGIGAAVAARCAADGAHVVVLDVNPERVEQAVDALPGRAKAHLGLVLDVRREDDMARMAASVVERFGRIDVLVASAGVLRPRGGAPKPIVDTTPEEWDYVVETNLRGTFLSNRAVLPTMIAQRRGDIVNVSSVSGKQGRAHDGPYCASKFGVIGLSESLAEEVRAHGVRVQVVMPDAVDTPIWEQNGPIPKPPDALAPARVATLIHYMVTQPADMILLGTVIAPFRSRRRGANRERPS